MKTFFFSLILILTSFFAFTASARTFGTADSYPNNFVALNWLFNKRIDITNLRDNIQEKGIIGITVKNKEGILFTKTPPIIGILNIPGFFILNKIYGVNHLTNREIVFSDYSQYIGKLLASFYCTIAALLLFLFFLKIIKNTQVSFLSALIFVFCTNVFNTASQDNWQHGLSLMLILVMLLISTLKKTVFRYVVIGILLGVLAQIRITNVFYLPFILLLIGGFDIKSWINNKIIWSFLIAFFIVFMLISSFYWLFDIPYGYGSSIIDSLKTFSPLDFLLALISIFISPNYGLFIYSPLLIISVFAAFHLKNNKSVKKSTLRGFLVALMPTLILFALFNAAWPYWTGGSSLGGRLMTESLPVWIGLLVYFQLINKGIFLKGLFILLLLVSVIINIVTTFMLDGWWFRFHTKQSPEYQLSDAWFHKPTLFEYLLRTRIIYWESLKKEDNNIYVYFSMRRPTFTSKSVTTLMNEKRLILKLEN